MIIQDNCSIHKTLEVMYEIKQNRLNVFWIIPYSPHLNLLAENYFGQLKFFTLYDLSALPNEIIPHDQINEHKGAAYFIHIMQQWDDMTREHYDAKSTSKIYGAWKSI